ncbi:uncharacterized protein [Diadema setosum]|uniref:uncharacterized protein n=1 Tax=Diadema setosum TaxID=31175 RepID=UPI003B3B1B09
MCLERCFALRAPLYYYRMATLCKAKIAASVALSLSFLISTLPVMGVGSYAVVHEVGNTTEVTCNPPGDSGTRGSPGNRAFTAIYLAFGSLMLILMYVSNGLVIFQLRQRNSRTRLILKPSKRETDLPTSSVIEMRTSLNDKNKSDVSPECETGRTNTRHGVRTVEMTRTTQISISKMVVVMSVVFTISWFPFYIQRLLKALDVSQPEWYLYVVIFLLVSNHVIDPFVFVFMKQQSRDALRELCMAGICCKKWRTQSGTEANDRITSGTTVSS